MFTQFRYTQDFGFGILLTEPTKLLNKPFPLTTTLPRRKATLNIDLCPLNRGKAALNLELGLWPVEPRLRRLVIDENKFDLLHFITFFDSCERKALRPLRSGRTDEINYKM